MQAKKVFYRLNFNITAPKIRLIDESGKQIGIVEKEEALKKAQELEIDLVEIAPNANPPVCRLIDFKKFRYLQARKEREERKKVKAVDLKEVQMGPFVADHDLATRLERIKEFLTDGDRVKVNIRFTGRQMAHPEFGFELLKKIKESLGEIAHVEREPKFEGRVLSLILSKSRAKREENSTV
ncbi:translation initiation factor IF-3 [Candidatus Microgenomates bacterium]|nr:translation initiation factor IF-3 [Candidatus Microgenomates bacterium]